LNVSGRDGEESSKVIEKSGEGKAAVPKLTLVDLRKTVQTKQQGAEGENRADEKLSAPSIESKATGGSGNVEVRELSLDLRGASIDRSFGTADKSPSPASQSDFRAVLAEHLQNAWNSEIVQSAHIVLRDGDSGIIRLRLKPESLGSVKIELNLTDNNISGRIVVESDEAKSAFERNMNELADAFKRGGFESASLQVSVGSGSGSGGRPGGGAEELPFYSERLRSAVDSSAEPSIASAVFTKQGSTVDMLA
jgi:flagellar hook-length control protein FliK